jgi:glycosyltransferase involved in cell wall biosynthesis
MPYFLRHYAPWVSKLIFYDGKSDDGTRDIIRSCHTAELRDWPGSDRLDDIEFLNFSNEQWKEARGQADWILWLDADEFVYHPNILGILERYLSEDVTVPLIEGFTMVSQTFPTTDGQIYDEIKTGFPDSAWGKPGLFREDIHFGMGRHSIDLSKCSPRFSCAAEIKMLHYRALGFDYVRDRHLRNWARVPEHCRQNSLGTNTSPDYFGHHSISWFEEWIKKPWPNVI